MDADNTRRPAGSDPHWHADGRPKSSPDETSMFGLNAVWSELEDTPSAAPRRSRHSARKQPDRTPMIIGIGVVAVVLFVIFWLVARAL